MSAPFPRMTASRLDLAEACPGAFALEWTRDTSLAARQGTAIHAFIERALQGNREGAIEQVPPDLRERCEGINVDRLAEIFAGPVTVEEAFAYDPVEDVAVSLGVGIGRDYSSAPANAITGTLDGNAGDAVGAVVADWKSGQMWVDHPKDNWQIKFGAVVKARTTGAHEVKGLLGKIDETGKLIPLTETWDAMGIDGLAVAIRGIWERVEKSRRLVGEGRAPELVVGEQCAYCPARTACPEQAKAAQMLVDYATREKSIAPQRAREIYRIAKAVKPAYDQVWKWLRSYAEETPIELGGGKVAKLTPRRTEILKLSTAVDLAAEVGVDPSVVLAAGSITKDGLESALGEEKATALLDLMRKKGGVAQATSYQLREVNS